MSVEAISIVLHHSRASGTDLLVLIGIANHHGDHGSWPKIETLARYARVQERAVQKSIKKLEALGEIVCGRRQGGTHRTDNRYRPNHYQIILTCPSSCLGDMNHTRRPTPPPVDNPAPEPAAEVSPRTPLSYPEVSAEVSPEVSQRTPPYEPSVEPPPVRARGALAAVIHSQHDHHDHHDNAERALTTAVGRIGRPGDVGALLVLAYEIGRGDPWIGYLMIRAELENGLPEKVHSLPALLRHRLTS